MFKRRDPRPWSQVMREMLWPRGGWGRAARYVWHRVRRLPDSPERIARGVFAGVAISFTPLFGLHFVGAALIARLYRGNIIAALLATFVGNPLTFPLFATMSLETGYWLLSADYRLPLPAVMSAFANAGAQFTRNLFGLIYGGSANWSAMSFFFSNVFLPYLVGAIIPGTLVGLAFQFATLRVIRTYQRLRRRVPRPRKRRASGDRRAIAQAEAADWHELRPQEPSHGRKRD